MKFNGQSLEESKVYPIFVYLIRSQVPRDY